MQLAWADKKCYIKFHSDEPKRPLGRHIHIAMSLLTRHGFYIGKWIYWTLKIRNYLQL
jgi:hypothetical protein